MEEKMKFTALHRKLGMVVISLSMVSTLFADVPGTLLLQAKVFIHRPEVFADRPYGSLPSGANSTIPGLWYVRLPASTAHLYGIDPLKRLVDERGIPGMDFTGEKDIINQDIEKLAHPALSTGAARTSPTPGARFKLLMLAGTQIDDGAMPAIGDLQDLEVLTLNDRITDKGTEWLKRLHALKELGLRGSQVTDKTLAVLKDLKQLERLDLRGTRVTDQGVKMLKGLPLIELQLNSGVSDAGILAVASQGRLKQLELSETQVADRILAGLPPKFRLQTLFLGPNTTDKGLESLSRLPSLQRLDLTRAHITDAGAAAISRLQNLEELALSETPVSDAFLDAIVSLKRLRYLEISGTQISEAGLQRLAELPALQVISFSAQSKVDPARLRSWRKLAKLHTVIINGQPMAKAWMEKLREADSQSWFFRWIPNAEAEEPPMQLAQLQDRRPFPSEGARDEPAQAVRVIAVPARVDHGSEGARYNPSRA